MADFTALGEPVTTTYVSFTATEAPVLRLISVTIAPLGPMMLPGVTPAGRSTRSDLVLLCIA